MKKLLFVSLIIIETFFYNVFGQSKIIVGIMPFTATNQNGNYRNSSENNYVVSIQDAVSESFLNTKRFTLVEREKMQLLKNERTQQQSEDFLDGVVVEQSKSLGARYIVTGNILEAGIVEKDSDASKLTGMVGLGGITARKGIVNFNLKVIDVETGEILASEKFSDSENGKNGFDKALQAIKPQISNFIKNNFKTIVSVASIEDEKNGKLLIVGGSSLGLTVGTNLRFFEEAAYMIEGKKIIRKKRNR